MRPWKRSAVGFVVAVVAGATLAFVIATEIGKQRQAAAICAWLRAGQPKDFLERLQPGPATRAILEVMRAQAPKNAHCRKASSPYGESWNEGAIVIRIADRDALGLRVAYGLRGFTILGYWTPPVSSSMGETR